MKLSQIKSLFEGVVTVTELTERVELIEARFDALLARVNDLEREQINVDPTRRVDPRDCEH